MTALTVQAALAIALQCAPGIDPNLLVGIANHESGLEPLTIHDNTVPAVLHGPDVLDAARRLIAAGHSVDLGPWQINSRNLDLLHLTIAEAFNPCSAVAAAARLLGLESRYNTGSPTRGIANGYSAAVTASIHAVKADGGADVPVSFWVPAADHHPSPFTHPAPTGGSVVYATKRTSP
jgi:type IV secretion system protein VirB1